MAKKAAKAKAGGKKKGATSSAPEFKYGIGDLAKKLDIAEGSARVRLRNAKVKKAGKSYGWNSEKELNEVVKSLSADAPAKSKKSSSKPAPKKATAKKPAKKSAKPKKPEADEDEEEEEEEDDSED